MRDCGGFFKVVYLVAGVADRVFFFDGKRINLTLF